MKTAEIWQIQNYGIGGHYNAVKFFFFCNNCWQLLNIFSIMIILMRELSFNWELETELRLFSSM